jgi:hypothetical protein
VTVKGRLADNARLSAPRCGAAPDSSATSGAAPESNVFASWWKQPDLAHPLDERDTSFTRRSEAPASAIRAQGCTE